MFAYIKGYSEQKLICDEITKFKWLCWKIALEDGV